MTWHVIPDDDDYPHAESKTCHCEPRIEYINGNMIIIHCSFDGREGVEQVLEILKKQSHE